MGIYNCIRLLMHCPRCGGEAVMDFDLHFGFRNLIEYQWGDAYQWTSSPYAGHGGRPDGGNCDGEAYTECPLCTKDFFAIARVRNDILTEIVPDLNQKGYKTG